MKNKNIINAWNEFLPDDETKNRMFDNIQKKYKRQSKWHGLKPTKILATAAALVFIIGLFNIQTVIAFFSGLFFVPGVGITNDGNIIYAGIDKPIEIETEYGTMTIEYISKVKQNDIIDLNIYMTAKEDSSLSLNIPIAISAYVKDELIFDKLKYDTINSKRGKAYFFTYRGFPDIDKFDLSLFGVSAQISLKKTNDELAFSKENNGVILAMQKVNGSEMYFTGFYGENINPNGYIFKGLMSKENFNTNRENFNNGAYDKNGNMFDLSAQGSIINFNNGYSIGFYGNANDISVFKCDSVTLHYGKTDIDLRNSDSIIDYPLDIFEIPIPEDGETIDVDIEIPIGQYIYRIISIRREGDIIYYEDNSAPLKYGTLEYNQAVENEEYYIDWARLITGDLSNNANPWWRSGEKITVVKDGIITNFDESADTIELALLNIEITQLGNFNLAFE